MTAATRRRPPVLLWPLVALWALVGFVLRTIGRALCALLGLVLMAIGVVLTMTIIGAIAGVPLAAFGLLLIARSIF